jgi:hypothetical protein
VTLYARGGTECGGKRGAEFPHRLEAQLHLRIPISLFSISLWERRDFDALDF